MIQHLEVTLQHSPEVVERVLRVTRHRGFRVTCMNMRLTDNSVALDMEVDSERAIELLSNQLNKLVDVTGCRVLSPVALSKVASA
ncbi:acetolactate synthase 2 small subunit [Shewanella cyperi]|uniref:Acetolactate synthase 2 small subunit n=2 Tax=Shewanella TaxID=22 RepID=A0A975AKJ1_9GAMM|nr:MULTISPECIES: acetolactate synthase 2 small subunit [Shewanella]QSX29791.1 acetolactate synthase 2 small subunit [Shewanella cyperi]QSX36963.1 acetolactate synthase 2 small subunit [Shewanella sedimentimangrovi]